MDIQMIVGETSFDRKIHIKSYPPGIWKFQAHSVAFEKTYVGGFPAGIKELIINCYPDDRSILEQFFEGDDSVWNKVRSDCVPQVFFYSLVNENSKNPISVNQNQPCFYSAYLPAVVFPKIYSKWKNINIDECRSRKSLFFSKLYKYSVKCEEMENFNREVIDFFEIYQEKYDIVSGIDISYDYKKLVQAPVFVTPRNMLNYAEETKKRGRFEFAHNDALGKAAMLPEEYRSQEAINALFPNISDLTFYEIEDSDFDGSGFSDYCGLGKALNFNLIDLIPAWSQNLTTLTYVITRKWGNLDSYKGNLRKLLQLANKCPNLVHFSLGMPFTPEGSVNLVNSKGRKVGDWSFLSRLKSFQLSYPLYSKGAMVTQNQSCNQRELVNIFRRLNPEKLEDFGLHITGRARLWMEVLHKLQSEAPGVFKKVTKLRLPRNSPNTRPGFILLACECFQLKYLDFYLHNYHNDFTHLAKLHRSLVTLFMRADTELTPITEYTMKKMPIFKKVTAVRIAPGVNAETFPRNFLSRVFPNADPYLSTSQTPDNNIFEDETMKFLTG